MRASGEGGGGWRRREAEDNAVITQNVDSYTWLPHSQPQQIRFRERSPATRKGSAGVTQPSDIVRDLSAWLEEASARRRRGEKQEIEVDLVRRAIAEIGGLREGLGGRRGTSSIAAEDLNASNDE